MYTARNAIHTPNMSHQDQNLCRGRSHVLKRSNHDPKSVERSWRCAIPATDKGTAFSIVSFRWNCGLYACKLNENYGCQTKRCFRKWNKENKRCFSRATSPHWCDVQNKSKKIQMLPLPFVHHWPALFHQIQLAASAKPRKMGMTSISPNK